MFTKRPDILVLGIGIIGIAAIVGLTWANYRFTSQNPGGNDFAPRWLATRLWITEGQSPYSEETTTAIQDFFYGRPARGNEDQQLFVYPHYAMFVFAPFGLVEDFQTARALWITALELSLLGIAGISLTLTRWRPHLIVLAFFFLFSVTWYHGVRPVINGNASVLVGLFLALALLLIQRGQDQTAGYMLALASIKPQMVALVIPFVFLWALSRRRGRIIWGTVVGMLVMVGGSLLIERGWILENLRQILTYPAYTEPGSPGAIFSVWWPEVGSVLGWVVMGVLALILAVEWLAAWGKDERWFLWTASLTLVITNLIGIRTATANYIALLPALALLFTVWTERWRAGGQWFANATMLVLLFGLWILFVKTVSPGAGNQPIQSPAMFFPLPVLLIIGLYWVRHWAVKLRRMPIESFHSSSKI